MAKVLLEAETPDWQLNVVGGLPDLPPFILGECQSLIEVSCEVELRVFSRARNHLVDSVAGAPIEPLFFEQVSYDFYLKTKTRNVSLELPPTAELRYQTDGLTHYALNFRNDVGYAELKIRGPQSDVALRIEVLPRKINYRADYVQMRDEVAAITRNLVMTVQARTFGLAAADTTDRPTLSEWFTLLQFYFKHLLRTARAITDNPHSQLVKDTEWVHPDRARHVDDRSLARMLRRQSTRASGVLPNTPLRLPARVPEVRQRINFDTPENRYYKALLLETQQRLFRLAQMKATGDEDADLTAEGKYFSSIQPLAEEMAAGVEQLLAVPFLREVSSAPPVRPNSMVFHRHPHYVAFGKWAQLVNGGLSVGGGPMQIGVKNIALLYEYWCFLRLVEILREQLELEQQSIVQVKHLRTTVVLEKGQESSVRFRDRLTGKAFFIVYNRLFSHLPTLNQQPDNVIQLADEERFFIFDAKYKLSFDKDYQARYGGVGPDAEDINTMHRYRDAIVLPHPLNGREFRRGVVTGAVILFPYPDEEAYQDHQFFRSIKTVRIGGLPFLPDTTKLVTDQLLELLQENGEVA